MDFVSYSCALCDKVFKSSTQLDIHVNGIHIEGKFQCQFCNQIIDSWSSLEEHEKKHTNLKDAHHLFENTTTIDKHHENKPDLEKLSEDSKEGNLLTKKDHWRIQFGKCYPENEEDFSNEGKDEKKHSLGKNYRRKELYYNEQRRKKRQGDEINGSSFLKCKICNDKFSNIQALSSHSQVHVKSTDRIFQCTKCGKKYAKKGTLREHQIFCIIAKEKFYCRLCDMYLIDTNLVHPKLHFKKLSQPKKSYSCDFCLKIVDIRSIRNHVIRCMLNATEENKENLNKRITILNENMIILQKNQESDTEKDK